jgi:hypothetical protein
MQATNSQTSTPLASLAKSCVDKVRNQLITYIEKEKEDYVTRTDIKFNSKKPSEILKKYSFSKHSTEKPRGRQKEYRRTSTGSSDSKNEEKKFFSRFIQGGMGKDFIDLRKQDVGIKKMEKVKKLTIDTNISFVEAFNTLQSSNRRKSLSFRFSHVNNCVEELFMTKEEREAKNIQEGFNKIQALVRMFKKAEFGTTTATSTYKDKNSNFLKYSEELFDILEFKGIKFDSKILSSESLCLGRTKTGSHHVKNTLQANLLPGSGFRETTRQKSKTVNNAISENNLAFRKKLFMTNDDDTAEATIGTGSGGKSKHAKEEDYAEDLEAERKFYKDILESPMIDDGCKKAEYSSNNLIEYISDIGIEDKASNLYESDCTPIHFRAVHLDSRGSKKYVKLVRCKRVSKVDSELSKFSEVSKSDNSRNVSYSISKEASLTHDSISEVSDDFEITELNNSCS